VLDRKLIRKDPERVREGIAAKGVEFDLDGFLRLDERMRDLLQETEALKHRRNTVSHDISRLKKEGGDASPLLAEMKDTSARIKEIDAELKTTEERMQQIELTVPNLPHDSVPPGTCPQDNPVVRESGEISGPPDTPLPHWEIGEKLGVLDLDAGAQLSGRGFVVLRGDGARLSRALCALMLDIHREAVVLLPDAGDLRVVPDLLEALLDGVESRVR